MSKKIIEIKWEQLNGSILSRLASYKFGPWCPAVFKDGEIGSDTYGIRIIVNGGYGHVEWGYFYMDETGLITESPRGMAKNFNKKVRIVNMDEMVEHYKDKAMNEF